jgi:PAS domain S-box-containing protein
MEMSKLSGQYDILFVDIFYCVTYDIAESGQSGLLLPMSSSYDDLYFSVPVMMHSIDADAKIVKVNSQWTEVMGYTSEEVIGRKSSEFLTDKSKKYAVEIILPEFFKTGSCTNVSYQFIKKNGQVIDVLLSAISERDEIGKVIKSIAVINNVTELIAKDKHASLLQGSIKEERLAEMCPRKKLLNLRVHQKISQEEMAERLNISYRTYQRVEYGESPITTDLIIKIAQEFQISPHYFF